MHQPRYYRAKAVLNSLLLYTGNGFIYGAFLHSVVSNIRDRIVGLNRFVRLGTAIISFFIGLPLMLVGGVLGGLFGLVRGLIHAVTRKPVAQEEINRLAMVLDRLWLSRTDTINNDDYLVTDKIRRLAIERHQAIKTFFSSDESKKTLKEMKNETDPMMLVNYIGMYLIGNPELHNGTKLFHILSELVTAAARPRAEVELKIAVTMMNQGMRDPNCFFSKVPKDVMKIIARQTVTPETLDDATVEENVARIGMR